MEKDSERDWKLSHKIYMEVVYKTFNRQKTPPLSTNRTKGGNKGKSRPYTMRLTWLTSTNIDDDDPFIEEINDI